MKRGAGNPQPRKLTKDFVTMRAFLAHEYALQHPDYGNEKELNMPAAKRIALPEGYSEARKIGREHNEKNDCTVISMVTVTGLPYSVCREALAAEGRKPGRGAYEAQWTAALRSLGFALREWTSAEKVAMSRSYWDVYGKSVPSITSHGPRRFPKCWANKGPLLFQSRGHLAGVDERGIVNDWSINRSLRIISVYSVTRIA